MITRTIHVVAAFCVSLLMATFASAGIQPQPFRTGLFGVIAGQSLRISIVNAGAIAGIIQPCFHVWNVDGTLLFEADAGPLAEGGATFVDFTPSPPPGGTVTGRMQLRAEIVFDHTHDVVVPQDPVTAFHPSRGVLATLEIFDSATGQTAFTSPFATVAGIEPQTFAEVAGVDPQPFRTGLFGATAGQSVRISVVNAANIGGVINPCVHVFGTDGTLLLDVDSDTPLGAGAGTFVDFPLGADAGRVQLRAEVELLPAVAPADGGTAAAILRHEIQMTVEVYDTATGRTVFMMPFVARAGIEPTPFQ